MEKLDLVRRQPTPRIAADQRLPHAAGPRIGKKTLVHMREINAQLERGFTKKTRSNATHPAAPGARQPDGSRLRR